MTVATIAAVAVASGENSKSEEAAIRRWLELIGETDQDLIAETLERCASDLAALRYFLMRAEEAPKPQAQTAQPVKCRECAHFKPDTIGDGQGIGECLIKTPASKRRLMWLNTERLCPDFRRTKPQGQDNDE